MPRAVFLFLSLRPHHCDNIPTSGERDGKLDSRERIQLLDANDSGARIAGSLARRLQVVEKLAAAQYDTCDVFRRAHAAVLEHRSKRAAINSASAECDCALPYNCPFGDMTTSGFGSSLKACSRSM
jgi:hypothetical protein